jgi:conjugative relaxase-like TrwC/TraI family protein
MLTISKPLSSGQAQTYHAKEFMSAEQNYWKQGDAIHGEWQGQMAHKYGLAGAIDSQHFARLSEGQNPHSGEQIVRHRTGQEYTAADGTIVKPVEHRAGWDATFSAPKSVSLTALVGGDNRVRAAHREAVTIALTELERYTQARIGGNNPAETTGKFIAAKFEHDTARPVEGYAAPQLHTHAVIFNMTERADGSTRALQERGFFDTQQFATAVYQSELTFRLRNLGYQIEAGKSGAPDIKGYTLEYLEASSPRRQQIEEAVAKSGFSGPEAAQIAAHNTRDKKDILSSSEVLAAHRKIAADFGNQADRVVAEAKARAETLQQNRIPDSRVRAQEAVSFAKDRGFEREAVTDEREIMRDAMRRGMGDLTYSQVRDNFDQRHKSGEFKIAPGQKPETGRQFTTRETIAAELATVGHMRRGQNTVEPIVPKETATAHAATRELLNPAQRRAIEEVLTSRDRVHGLQGLAGTGKTTTLEAIREGAERSGYAVEGFAPTSRAAGAKERTVTFDASQMQHFDHGYAVTSHSSQGLTADRVLVNMDTNVHPELINTRFAYVSVSRASENVRIYTNDVAVLSERLSTDVTKTSAVDIQTAHVEPTSNQQTQTKEPPMTNNREHSQEELRRQILAEASIHAPENISITADIGHRHNAPIQTTLPNEASDYEWKRETGEVQSYQHNQAGSWLHIDPQGQFYDRKAQPITRETALEQAGLSNNQQHTHGGQTESRSGPDTITDQGISL